MSELAELLELLHRSRSTFRNVRATVRYQRDQAVCLQSIRRERGTTSGSAVATTAKTKHMAPIERTSSFWIAGPRLVRCERELVVEDKLSLEVAVGDGVRWWYRAARPKIEPREDGFITSEFPELSLFNPWHLASSLELRSAGRTVCAGRDALAAHGTSQHSGFLHIPTAERYELAVDAERGVILKHDALFDERSLEVYEVIDIAFDADLDPGLFRVEGAPEHVNIARVSGRGRESMCSFCGLTRSQVMSLIAGDGACICDGCIDLCKEIIDEQRLVPG